MIVTPVKSLHGVYFNISVTLDVEGVLLDYAFLRSSDLNSDTEGFILACQNGIIGTLPYRRIVMLMSVPDTRCRDC